MIGIHLLILSELPTTTAISRRFRNLFKEVIENRLKVYHDLASPIEAFYKRRGLLKVIAANRGFDEITHDILAAIS